MSAVDYVNNPNQRTPCLLVLDVSGSMTQAPSGSPRPIDELNYALTLLEESLKSDPTALTRVQLAIVTVGGPRNTASTLMDWTDCAHFEAIELAADGLTPLAEGILLGHQLLEQSKQRLRDNGISYTRPWMLVITDGEPTSTNAAWQQAVSVTRHALANRSVELFSIGVSGADMAKLGELGAKPAELRGLEFRSLFKWLSSSLSAVSRSRPGDKLNLPSTDPWRNVGV